MSRNRTIVISIVAIAILAVALFLVPQVLAPAGCPAAEVTAADIEETVAFGRNIFRAPQWRLESGTHPGLVSVGWFDDASEGIAHMQMLLYPCGYSQADIDKFYGPDGFNVMLGGYESHTETAVCADGDLTLHEFEVGYAGRPYMVRFWIAPVSPTQVRDVHLGFYPDDAALMDEYAARLFPSLPSCV